LTDVARKKIRTFSGGMKRRVNLAIGIINEPLILFLDEPTVGVDVQSKRAIMQYLEELNERGTTIIYTSHHLREAEEFCDRILLMDHGKMIALNNLDRLLKEHDAMCLEDFFMKLTGSEYRD
jgi:ABC-2 type transport system ATP-binding protein